MVDVGENDEVDVLIGGILDRCGNDFRKYIRKSVIRRIQKFQTDEKLDSIRDVRELVFGDEVAMCRLLEALSVNVTEMFRDPEFYSAFRKFAIPRLKTYPSLRFWVAGCATGEEALSLAILLHEANILDRSRIYATDITPSSLAIARRGIVPVRSMAQYSRNYVQSGGVEDFSQYYTAKYDHAIFREFLTRNIFFAKHDLSVDKSFSEFQAIFCRNVMIYFDRELQEQVMKLFCSSLCDFGFLGIGSRESIYPHSLRNSCHELSEGTRLFQFGSAGCN